jgi:hypothetical protein
MKARRLIESSDFPPEALHVMFQAFDEAWAEVSHHFATDEAEKVDARTRLAHAILAVARRQRQRGAPQERGLAGDGHGLPRTDSKLTTIDQAARQSEI